MPTRPDGRLQNLLPVRKPINLHLPMKQPEDVIPHLGKRALHWKVGYSAHELVQHWWRFNAIPPDVLAVLDTAEPFRGPEFVDAFFERDTQLGDSGRCSQTDLLAILALADGELAVMGVEAKVNEPFGKLIGEELEAASAASEKPARIARLCRMLGLDPDSAGVPSLRYQLLHRTAAALFEAQRYRTRRAIMLVETFSREDAHWEDFAAFARALGGNPKMGALCAVAVARDTELWLGWCNSVI